MRSSRSILALAACLALAHTAPARAELTLPRISPNATVSQTIGTTTITLTYSRPGVKGRPIWGALVPYGKTWRTGANDATTFTTTDSITVSGQSLPAGTYSFFTIPTAETWTVIFSKLQNQNGAFGYDSTQDQLRVTAAADTTQPNQEWMELGFENLSPTTCDLVLRWEKLRLAVPITVDVNDKVLADSRREIANLKADDWRTPYRAAGWAFDSGIARDEANGWLDRSLAIDRNFQNLGLKARRLAKDGKLADAVATAKQGVAAGKAAKDKPDTAPLEKQIAEWQASMKPASKGKAK